MKFFANHRMPPKVLATSGEHGVLRSLSRLQTAFDAVADAGSGSLDGITGEVSVAGGGLDLGMVAAFRSWTGPR